MKQPRPLLIRVDRRAAPGRPDEGLSLAELLNVSDKTAWRLVQDGAVESVKIRTSESGEKQSGGRRLVVLSSVHDYLARLSRRESA